MASPPCPSFQRSAKAPCHLLQVQRWSAAISASQLAKQASPNPAPRIRGCIHTRPPLRRQELHSRTAHKPQLPHSPTATAPEQAMPATVRTGSGGRFAAGSCLVWDTQTHPALQSDAQNEKRILVEVAFSSTPRLARGLLLSVSQKWPLVAQQLRTRHGGGPNRIDAWQWAEENRRRWHVDSHTFIRGSVQQQRKRTRE